MLTDRTNSTITRRRGAVLLFVIVCVGIAGVVFAVVTRLAVAERRRLETELWQVQAAWLAESALERAAAQLRADPDYSGETWKLPADTLTDRHPALVAIEVEAVDEVPNHRLVRVRADYPDDPVQRARRSKECEMRIDE